jgi:hypothetical protein
METGMRTSGWEWTPTLPGAGRQEYAERIRLRGKECVLALGFIKSQKKSRGVNGGGSWRGDGRDGRVGGRGRQG